MVFTGHHCITTIMNNAASFNLDLNRNPATLASPRLGHAPVTSAEFESVYEGFSN